MKYQLKNWIPSGTKKKRRSRLLRARCQTFCAHCVSLRRVRDGHRDAERQRKISKMRRFEVLIRVALLLWKLNFALPSSVIFFQPFVSIFHSPMWNDTRACPFFRCFLFHSIDFYLLFVFLSRFIIFVRQLLFFYSEFFLIVLETIAIMNNVKSAEVYTWHYCTIQWINRMHRPSASSQLFSPNAHGLSISQ